MLGKFDCTILTPEKMLYKGDAEFTVVQAYNGEMGFLYNHTPLIAELGVGELRITNESSTKYFVVEGGIVEINNNSLTIIAENAFLQSELDDKKLAAQLKEIKRKINERAGHDLEQLQIEEKLVRARLKVSLR